MNFYTFDWHEKQGSLQGYSTQRPGLSAVLIFRDSSAGTEAE